jgi:hypothetical protein
MENTGLILIIAAIISLIIIVWGFNKVSRQEMTKSERILWKVFFILTPVITFLLFLMIRKPSTR